MNGIWVKIPELTIKGGDTMLLYSSNGKFQLIDELIDEHLDHLSNDLELRTNQDLIKKTITGEEILQGTKTKTVDDNYYGHSIETFYYKFRASIIYLPKEFIINSIVKIISEKNKPEQILYDISKLIINDDCTWTLKN